MAGSTGKTVAKWVEGVNWVRGANCGRGSKVLAELKILETISV